MFWIKSQATNLFYEFLFILIKINLKYNFFSEDLKIDTGCLREEFTSLQQSFVVEM